MDGPNDLTDEVLDYLRNHASAADTIDGIINWWLPRQRYETARAKVQQALDYLLASGLVEKKILADGTTIYRSRARLLDRVCEQRPRARGKAVLRQRRLGVLRDAHRQWSARGFRDDRGRGRYQHADCHRPVCGAVRQRHPRRRELQHRGPGGNLQ